MSEVKLTSPLEESASLHSSGMGPGHSDAEKVEKIFHFLLSFSKREGSEIMYSIIQFLNFTLSFKVSHKILLRTQQRK